MHLNNAELESGIGCPQFYRQMNHLDAEGSGGGHEQVAAQVFRNLA